jgi:very-short-patch-repair endonuclease
VCSFSPNSWGKSSTPPDAGFNAKAIAYRLKIGRLQRLHQGVYAVGHRPPSPHARDIAAVLACGPSAALSHRSAAALWGITRPWRGPVEVTARTDRRRFGINTHRSTTLTHADITRHYGIPITTPARTLDDLARVLPSHSLTRAVNEARIRNLISDRDHDSGPTRSVLEDAFLRFIDRYDLTRPEVNQIVAGKEVDMLWRDHKLIVELDSRTFHRDTFEEDRERDAHLLSEGFVVLRVTWRRLTESPEREARRLRRLLSGEGGIRTLGRG